MATILGSCNRYAEHHAIHVPKKRQLNQLPFDSHRHQGGRNCRLAGNNVWNEKAPPEGRAGPDGHQPKRLTLEVRHHHDCRNSCGLNISQWALPHKRAMGSAAMQIDGRTKGVHGTKKRAPTEVGANDRAEAKSEVGPCAREEDMRRTSELSCGRRMQLSFVSPKRGSEGGGYGAASPATGTHIDFDRLVSNA